MLNVVGGAWSCVMLTDGWCGDDVGLWMFVADGLWFVTGWWLIFGVMGGWWCVVGCDYGSWVMVCGGLVGGWVVVSGWCGGDGS